jgi:hypothetical protein
MLKINWFTKILMRFAPKTFLLFAAKKQGIKPQRIDYAMKLFGGNSRVDIHPLPSQSGRGFIVILDNKLSLYFYQDGDHFYYDGCEMGEYEKGDVTIFDRL